MYISLIATLLTDLHNFTPYPGASSSIWQKLHVRHKWWVGEERQRWALLSSINLKKENELGFRKRKTIEDTFFTIKGDSLKWIKGL